MFFSHLYHDRNYFSTMITSLGEERANLSAFRTFVRFALVWFCLFSVPLGVWEGLRFVIVALHSLDVSLNFSFRKVLLSDFGLFLRIPTFNFSSLRTKRPKVLECVCLCKRDVVVQTSWLILALSARIKRWLTQNTVRARC